MEYQTHFSVRLEGEICSVGFFLTKSYKSAFYHHSDFGEMDH